VRSPWTSCERASTGRCAATSSRTRAARPTADGRGNSPHARWSATAHRSVRPSRTVGSGYHLVAPDLSGHGDSEHLASYDVRGWAEEILAAAGAEDLQQPVVIGHSLGGRVAINAGVDHANCISGVAFIDSPLSYQQPDEDPPYRWDRPHRVYAEADEAIERFRTLPPQETLLPYVRRHIARESLKRIDRGWTWKFDPLVFDRRPPLQEELARLAGPVALLRCEHGLVDVAMAAEMQRLATRPFPVIDLPAAGHHPMLDQPLTVVTALTTLLHVWPPR